MKPPFYWTEERIREVAKECISRSDFYNKYSTACVKARELQILDGLFPRKHKPNNYWNEENIRKHAKEFRTKTEFCKKYTKGYYNALKLNIIDDLNFKTVGHKFKRCVYIFKFELNYIYIGLTCDYERRIQEHLGGKYNTTVQKFMQQNPSLKFDYYKISKYIDSKQAAIQEKMLINKYKKEGYNILNKVKGGGLGGFKKYSNEYIFNIFKQYTKASEVIKEYPGVYHAAQSRKILNKVKYKNGTKGGQGQVSKSILLFTIQNKFIKKYSSAVEAANDMHMNKHSIRAACRGNNKHILKGFIWKYEI